MIIMGKKPFISLFTIYYYDYYLFILFISPKRQSFIVPVEPCCPKGFDDLLIIYLKMNQ